MSRQQRNWALKDKTRRRKKTTLQAHAIKYEAITLPDRYKEFHNMFTIKKVEGLLLRRGDINYVIDLLDG